MTVTIAESIYNFFDVNDKLPVEHKECKKKSRGTKVQLLIDMTILQDCRKRNTNLGMAWIDYKKAYDMVSHSWILVIIRQHPRICKKINGKLINSVELMQRKSGER